MCPVLNDVETGKTLQYPDLKPQRFAVSVTVGMEEAEAVARTMLRWQVDVVDLERHRIDAVYKTRLGFKDDITIVVTVDEDGGSVVSMRSRSRLGRSDFGQNARTIRKYQQALGEAVRARLACREPGT